jgi:recombination DNA repair RAD52 pathway protein
MSDITEQLRQDVPAEFVSERSGLSYVTGRYVKQRLNELFGPDGWDFTIVQCVPDRENMSCFVHGQLTVRFGAETCKKDAVAVGFASGRSNNEAFDFACAEAVTDALKRAAVGLGQTLGLSLYPLTAGGAKKKAAPKKSKPAKKAAPKKPSHSSADQATTDGDDEDW